MEEVGRRELLANGRELLGNGRELLFSVCL